MSALEVKVSEVKQDLLNQAAQMEEAEVRIAEVESSLEKAETSLTSAMKRIMLLEAKTDDLENRGRNGTTRYKDIISKSRLICSGPPAVYQVKPKKEIIETLTKLTIGERNLNKANRAILLVGETGAGKSSLVNALLNYAMGVKFEDDIWFQIVDEEKKKQTTSLTSDVIIYQIFGYEDQILPFSLTIIDTPGYGDTRGIKHDAIVSERLLDLFAAEDGVIEINAVALVMKASDNRLSDRLRYIFNSVMSLFGKNLENKIVVLITHSDGRKPENVLKALEKEGIRSAKNEEDEAVHFLFNNRQEDERTEEDPEYLKHLSKISERGFRAFTDLLEKSAPQRLKTTTKVLKERRKLTASIQDLEDRIKKIELKETEIKQIKEDLKRAEDENNHVVMMKEKRDTEKVKKLEEMKSRLYEGTDFIQLPNVKGDEKEND
ncbi:septin-1-like [Poecilia reticulata]|uniref:septin-1-like n=1 Tax=Poecilia reticulata TaxID=8081 RepID=UPI0007EC22A1|nr:PREDICTED: septin-1-like [Poecilia reticulata]